MEDVHFFTISQLEDPLRERLAWFFMILSTIHLF